MKGDDWFVGDSMVTGDGTATGGGNDHFTGSSGQGLRGRRQLLALRAGDRRRERRDQRRPGQRPDHRRQLHARPASPPGAGTDQLHSLQGNDTAYGDNYAADPAGRTSGGAHDFIGGSSGDDHLYGGPEHDTCNGGPNRDTASQCEYVLEVP